MRHLSLAITLAVGLGTLATHAQGQAPFKLGTFERQGGTSFVGIVLDDTRVIDLAAANTAIRTPASRVASPTDMKDVITRYDTGLRARIGEIVAAQHRDRDRNRLQAFRALLSGHDDFAGGNIIVSGGGILCQRGGGKCGQCQNGN